MLAYIGHHVLRNPGIDKYIILLSVSLILCLGIYGVLHILHKASHLTFDEYIPLEQAVVSLLIAMWSFCVFCLPVALVIWITFYFLYSLLEHKNAIVGFYMKHPSKKYNPHIMEKHFRSIPHATLLRSIFAEKSRVKTLYEAENATIKPQKRPIPIKIYLSGFAVYLAMAIIEPSSIADSKPHGSVLLENLMFAGGLFYIGYIFMYLIYIKHPLGDYREHPRLFHALTVLWALLSIGIAIGITFH